MNQNMRHKGAIDVPHPECDKALAVKGECQVIGNFLEWAEGQGLEFGKFVPVGRHNDRETEFVPANQKIDKLLAEYFQIDEAKMEQEKRALLDELRRRNNSQN